MLRIRWLGRVPYQEAHALQKALHGPTACDEDASGHRRADDYLLLLEHPGVITLGVRGDERNVLVDAPAMGVPVVRTDRGGDVTYHGPGQLVAYPIVEVPTSSGAVPRHVQLVEQVVIDALDDLGVRAGRLPGFPGVWVDALGPSPRKICAIGVRVSRGRSMHGLALNVDPDLEWFARIVPCGIADKAVTSLAREGVRVPMRTVADAVADHAARRWAPSGDVDRQDVAWPAAAGRVALGALSAREAPSPPGAPSGARLRLRVREAGVDLDGAVPWRERKPPWLRVPARMGVGFLGVRRAMRDLELATVCEEAGCPNIFECWAEGTATFMINGTRCTRACGFCEVDTRRPLAVDPGEPERVAAAVERLGLAHAVVTAVARDDLPDGGASGFVATIEAVRARCPGTSVEVLIPDCKGDRAALASIMASVPDVLNHNVETVPRLQRAVRPSAGYARSLAVLAQARAAGLRTKSGMIVGMGEEEPEVLATLADLRAVGVDVVTVGQYLRPSPSHLPVVRWWTLEEFDRVRAAANAMGFAHVEASPLTRSSYHARRAASVTTATRSPVGAGTGP